ncbi:MAG TPA: tyrosine-type recombinase/integrase [Roseiarcus sp.]|nr:tyrosine-type recombinase/integrase [Roseiarcus sp.]
MSKIDLKYLSQEIDRHGNVRVYVRRKGLRIRIEAPPGTPKFMDEYKLALERLNAGKMEPDKRQHVGTVGWLSEQYYKSPQFAVIDNRQQRVRRLVTRAMLDEPTKEGSKYRFYDCPISEFTSDHVRLLRNRRRDAPSVANRRVGELRKMFAWGVEEYSTWVKRNVATDVASLPYEKEGFRAWTHEDVAKFEAYWPVGSAPRLALAIMLYTGVRRSDVVLLGPPMVKDGSITFMPQKTRKQKKVLTLPVLPVLQDVIDKTPTIGMKTFLVTHQGKPFTAAGFGNWFREKCDRVGLKECTAHGIRKIAAETAAENGATEKEMMDIFGWTKSDLAAYYARKANQKKIAGNAMHKMIPIGS